MKKKPLVIIDTSVFVSALLSSNFNSAPNLVINRWRENDFILVITPQIEEEIAVVLTRRQVEEEMIVSLFDAFDDLAFYQEGIYSEPKSFVQKVFNLS